MNFFDDARTELARSKDLHGERFASLHEGYAVLLEEVDELWEIVRQKRHERKPGDVYTECVQIAAMAAKIAEAVGGR